MREYFLMATLSMRVQPTQSPILEFFSIFLEHYLNFEPKNYINECKHCSDPCFVCEVIGKKMFTENTEDILHGLDEELYRYSTFNLKEFGLYLVYLVMFFKIVLAGKE